MDSRGDSLPFGYEFPEPFLGGDSGLPNGRPHLLNDGETQGIMDFFSQNPWESDLSPTFASHLDTKNSLDSFNFGNYMPPATIHGVSTTIPDQAQLHHHDFNNFDHNFGASEPLSAGHLGNTQDDLQAATTLFSNAQASYTNGRAHSFHGRPSANVNAGSVNGHDVPMVPTPHGLIPEQIAALMPNHSTNGSFDSEMVPLFAGSHVPVMTALERPRPHLKRSYTYGTDHAFNSSGFAGTVPIPTEEDAAQRVRSSLGLATSTRQSATDSNDVKLFPTGRVHTSSDDDRQSDEETSGEASDDAEDRPTKKRRKGRNSTSSKTGKSTSARKNSTAARSSKNSKASLDETNGKKKRLSSAGQKAQRENLSDEQKRSNHILSEQKRRNLIKRGFDDLHSLVPEIRSGGLSKSSVLTEAANFLDKLIEENNHFAKELAADADG